MATRTISNTGGNYNAVGTWTEGIVPTSADDVVATATSGPLTVNVASAAQTFNFTNYTNTLTVNATWTVSGTTGTNTIVSAMTIAGSSNITLTGAGGSLTTNGKVIPNLSIGGSKTLNDDLNVTNFTITASITLTGTRNITVTGNCDFGAFNSPTGSGITLNLTGTGNFVTGACQFLRTVINTAGTITFSNANGIGFAATSLYTPAFQYITGTIAGTRRFRLSAAASGNNTFELNTGTLQWNEVNLKMIDTTTATDIMIITLSGNVQSNSFRIWGDQVSRTMRFTGTGRLIGGDLSIMPWQYNLTGNIVAYAPTIQLGSTATHSFSAVSISGIDTTTKTLISSQTASTTAFFASTGTQSIQLTDFTDINASNGPLSVFRGTLTRTTSITNYTSFGSGAGGSFTFVN